MLEDSKHKSSYRYKAIVSYHGGDFSGFQSQKDAVSVQSVFEDAIYQITHEKVRIYASGRTDAGVHAYGQVVHFDLSKYHEPTRFKFGLNYYFKPNRMAISSIEIIDDDFHARFSAKKRRYVYKVHNADYPDIFELEYSYHVKKPLDVEIMKEASKALIGRHDFTSFRALGCQAKSPIITLDEIVISSVGEKIFFYLSARSFLYKMVRNIVGTLLEVGKGYIHHSELEDMLLKCNRSEAGPTAPPHGLYFLETIY